MIRTLVMIFHVFLAFGLVSLILLQRGKGAEVGTAFGAGASGTVFGARGSASFLTRATAVLATLFFVTSLSLAFLSSRREAPTSVLDTQTQEQPAPADSGMPPAPQGSGTSAGASGATAPTDLNAPQEAPAPDRSAEPPGDEDGAMPQE
jgi:preprotein translocase subunit SecG